MDDEKPPVSEPTAEDDRALDARREVLKRMGIYTAVSAPILLGALKAERAVASSNPGGPPVPGGGFTGASGSGVIP